MDGHRQVIDARGSPPRRFTTGFLPPRLDARRVPRIPPVYDDMDPRTLPSMPRRASRMPPFHDEMDPRTLSSMGAARLPPALPADSARRSLRTAGPGFAAARPASASRYRPSSASNVHRPPPRGAPPIHQRQPRMSMPERLRRTMSWDPSSKGPSAELYQRSAAPASAPGSDECPSAAVPSVGRHSAQRGRIASNLHILRQNRAREVKAREAKVRGVFSR